jgi:2-polyprenyl-3-methyl-5-hydroxy-6-metoxy-1,4-benzoquinol methylase
MESIYESTVDVLRPNDAHGISLQLVGKNKRVLELGAASGHVTKALKGLGNTVVAVERDGRFRESLAKLADEAIITDLDWLDLRERLNGQKFDVILAGDVLEHCSKPELVLLQLHDLLLPNGCVVISLSNIAHGDVRLSLLTGQFKYSDTGLLDRTHLRFFTRETIDIFLEENNFEVAEVFASTASIGTTEFGLPRSDVPTEAIRFVESDRDSTVYQYILKAIPNSHYTSNQPIQRVERSDDSRVDQLLAQICLYQEAIAQRNAFNARELRQIDEQLQKIEGLEKEVSDLQQQLADSQQIINQDASELQELYLACLNARDSAIGSAAELGEMRFRLEKARAEIDSLVHQLDILHSSRTWKAGRFVFLPLRAVRKVIRLLVS